MAQRDIKPSSTLPITERRRFIRHPLCFTLAYRVIEKAPGKSDLKNPENNSKSTTINISMGGLLFAAKRPVKVDSIILVKLPFQDKIFHVKAKVVHCDMNPETKLYNIGCAFHRLGAAYKVKLVEQLYLISEFRDLKSIELGKEVSLEQASEEWIKRYSDRFRKLYW